MCTYISTTRISTMNVVIITVLLCFHIVKGARILCYYPAPMISHQVVFRALTQELARRGHALVVIAPDPHMASPSENVTEIILHDRSYILWRNKTSNLASRETESPLEIFYNVLMKSGIELFDEQMSAPEVKSLIDDKDEQFDLVILESVLRASYFLTHRFRAPVIGFSSLTGLQFNYDSMGVPTHPLLYPDLLQTKVSNFTLWDKVDAIYTHIWQTYASWKISKDENRVGMKHFGKDVPDVMELTSNTDLLFLNVHPVWDGIRPTPPSVIYVGGMHIKQPKELPKELKIYMDGCKQGIIYMSLGSNIKSAELPPEKIKIFLEVFGNIPYCVLWKWESRRISEKPDNVRLEKWLPQSDLLVHPNLRAFITQGGLQSADEAIAAKVPLIGIPFMSDQGKNVQKIVSHGIGVALDIKTITSSALEEAIRYVTTDKSFHANLVHLSALLRDSPMAPLERAVWWTEYLLRHGSARHLRSPAADVSFYEYWMLDALAAVLGAILACLLLAASVSRLLFVQMYGFIRQCRKIKSA